MKIINDTASEITYKITPSGYDSILAQGSIPSLGTVVVSGLEEMDYPKVWAKGVYNDGYILTQPTNSDSTVTLSFKETKF